MSGPRVTVVALLILSLLGVGLLAWWLAPWPARKPSLVQPSALAFPVLLVNEDKIAEVCLDHDELMLRPENTDHVIEQRFHVVAADGRRYAIVNFQQGQRPSILKRVGGASVFQSKVFRVSFELRPQPLLTRDEALAQLRDRPWPMPATTAATPTLAELFIAYRAERWREFGNRRDHMPDAQTPATKPQAKRP